MTFHGGREGWMVLARLAAYAVRHMAAVKVETSSRSSGPWARDVHDSHERALHVTVVVPDRERADTAMASPEPGEEFTWAENEMCRWAELAEEFRDRAGPPAPPDAMAAECPTCDAGSGAWCRPVHEGERAAGSWLHPARRVWHDEQSRGDRPPKHEWRPDPRAIEVARASLDEIEYGDRLRSPLAGLPRMIIQDITRLCRHVLAVDRRDRLGIQTPPPRLRGVHADMLIVDDPYATPPSPFDKRAWLRRAGIDPDDD